MRWRSWWAVGLSAAMAAPAVQAQTLYAASERSAVVAGAEGVAGSLYTVNLASGSPTFVAPVRLNGVSAVGIRGMAAHPQTGAIYGITSSSAPGRPQSLVTIDPANGRATLVAQMRIAGSDLAFNRAGILFTWLPGTSQLGMVDIEDGGVTPIGPPRGSGVGTGLAIDEAGRGYIARRGATGTLEMVDLATGGVRNGPPLTGAPFPSAITSLTFTPSGLLIAVNSNAGSPASTRLVTINVATGAVSNIGTLPDDTDALAFSPDLRRQFALSSVDIQTLALLVLGAIALILGLIGWFVGRKPA